MVLLTRSFVLAFTLVLCLGSQSAFGKALTETQIYKRCYAQLTESALPLNDARMARVRNKTVTGVQACGELLNEANFDANGRLITISPVSMKIVKTFNSIHRSWFTATRLQDISDFDYDINPNTPEVFDQTEQSLFLTRFMFTPSLHYRNMLRGNRGVRAVRQEDPNALVAPNSQKFDIPNVGRYLYVTKPERNANKFAFQRGDIITRDLFNQYAGQDMSVYVTLPMMTAGEVVGVIPNDLSAIVPNFSFDKGSTNYSAQREFGNNAEYSFDIYKNRGGGLLGSPGFFLMNSGHPNGTRFDGQLKVPRTWSKAIMESLLCATIPSLRFEDVPQFQDINSSTSFRQSRSCVRCHATLDPFAYTARNLIVANGHGALSGVTHDPNAKYTMLVGSFTPNLPSTGGRWPAQAQENFYRQEPKGTLRFRTSSGMLVDQDVNNMEELGQRLSDNEDYYRCAAKRYFEHFTGIKVSLHDPTNPENEKLNELQTPTTLSDRKFVENLAVKLQTSGSLNTLIRDILQSNYYKHSNFRPEGN